MRRLSALRLRPLILQLHLYGGLVCCWYLLVFGVSSLTFQHEWLLPGPSDERAHRELPLTVSADPDDSKLAEKIREAAQLPGWPMPWTMRHDEEGELHFEQASPGRQYWIHVDRSAGVIRVEDRRNGLRSIVRSLHGPTQAVPNLPFTGAWCAYTEVTTWFVVFSFFSGIYLWASRPSSKQIALLVFLGGVTLTLVLMCWLFWLG